MEIVIKRVTELPDALAVLIADAERDGWRFVRRLADEWAAGVNRFDRPGEALFAASAGGVLVGVCGLNVDPYAADPSVGRVRRLYVLRAWRGRGVGRLLLQTVIDAARGRFRSLRVRTESAEAGRLYEKLGFVPAVGVPDCTHALGMIALRPYRPDDAPALLALFRDTVRRVNARDYSPEQVRAWASDDIDPAAWAARFDGRFAVVAEGAGFADLTADGHLDRLFVSADHQRRGVGRALVDAVVAEARRRGLTRLTVEASITARPFFEAQGFTTIARQTVTVRGVEFVNYRMERVVR